MAVKQEGFKVAADKAQLVREFRQRYWRWHTRLPLCLVLLPMLPAALYIRYLFYIQECALEELSSPEKKCSHRSVLTRVLVAIVKRAEQFNFVSMGWDMADESLAEWLQRTHRVLFSVGSVLVLVMEVCASLAIWYALFSVIVPAM